MTDVVARAKDYLAHNAAESGADELIRDLIAEIEWLRQRVSDLEMQADTMTGQILDAG